jgi:hypothetical protein
MAHLRDDGVSSIARALAVVPGVNMDIGDYRSVRLPTTLPYRSQLGAVEFDNSVRKTGRIHIIVEEEVFHSAHTTFGAAEKERATLSSTSPPPKLVNPAMPKVRVADKPRRLAQRCAQERWK